LLLDVSFLRQSGLRSSFTNPTPAVSVLLGFLFFPERRYEHEFSLLERSKTFEQLALENLSEIQFKALTGSYEVEKQHSRLIN